MQERGPDWTNLWVGMGLGAGLILLIALALVPNYRVGPVDGPSPTTQPQEAVQP